MDMKKRRDLQLAYIADETIMEEQRRVQENPAKTSLQIITVRS